MKRFFYADPLAAAWMAKHFGMRFISTDKDENDTRKDGSDILLTLVYEDDIQYANGPAKWYVHADSLHLLEPQVGDIVESQHVSGVYDVVVPNGTYCAHGDRNTTPDDVKKYGDRIIQRNDIPFMWPESEDA